MRAQCRSGCSMRGRMPPQGDKDEGFSPGSGSCKKPTTIKPSISSKNTRGSSSPGPLAAGCAQPVADRVDKENLERALARADTSCGASCVGTDHLCEGIHRAGEETVGCLRGGSHRGCPDLRRVSQSVSQSLSTGRETPRRIALAAEGVSCNMHFSLCCTSAAGSRVCRRCATVEFSVCGHLVQGGWDGA